MARRKIQQRNIRSLSKTSSGKSYSVTLPVEVIRRWRWKTRQKVQLTIDEKKKKITIEDWKR
ncbi:MAG: hypothetical protein ABIA02_00510 [Candidatus Falkowbacteria bacterium]